MVFLFSRCLSGSEDGEQGGDVYGSIMGLTEAFPHLILKDTSKPKELREKIDVTSKLRNFSRTETTRKKKR